MDMMTEVLDGVRSAGALVGRSLLSPPWSLRFEESASLTLVTMLRGDAWVDPGDGETVHLGTGDIGIVTGPAPFTVTSEEHCTCPPVWIQTMEGTCTDEAGNVLGDEQIGLGTRTWGTSPEGEHTLLSGTYATGSRVADRLLAALPRVLVVPAESVHTAALTMLEAEISVEEPGQEAVIDRLLDLVLVGALRDWFAGRRDEAPGWYRATSDPVVGPALKAIHDAPADPWTVESLAALALVSRAAFARRFAEMMGEPPISYLTSWRLCMAADLLNDTSDTVDTVARKVGYSGAFAFSQAFTREYGQRPGRFRRA
ncbi:MAG: AraC family transcriptional regulator [Corynebacterium sp.]|uniref:AraC family transcriptional regulator n=1 Tax=Corynebacterium sp. TaxID=1720 RepID=UPI003F9CF5A9